MLDLAPLSIKRRTKRFAKFNKRRGAKSSIYGKKNVLNKRVEFISKCHHENKFYLSNTRRARKIKREPIFSLVTGRHLKDG